MSRFGGWLAERRATRVALIAALFPLLPILSSGVAVFDAIARGWRTAVLDCLIALGLLIAVTLLLGGDWQQILIGAGMVWSIAIGGGYLVGAFGSLTLPVQVLVMLGVIGVIAFYAAVSDSVAFWETGLTWFAEQLQQSGYPVADTSVLHPIATVMTGVAGALWVLTATVGLLLGSWWASGAGGPGFREMFLSLRMGYVIGGLAALAGIGSLVGAQPFSGNVLLVLSIGLGFQGLAVIHWHVNVRQLAWPWLIALYLPLFMGVPIALSAMFLFTTVGFLDNWYGLRRIRRDMF